MSDSDNYSQSRLLLTPSPSPAIVTTDVDVNDTGSKGINSLYVNGKVTSVSKTSFASGKTSYTELSNQSSVASSRADLSSAIVLVFEKEDLKSRFEANGATGSTELEDCHVSEAKVEVISNTESWSKLSSSEKFSKISNTIGKVALVFVLLYIFVCSLDLMGSSLKLIAGKTAGDVFTKDSLLSNPVAGLMVGVLATVLVQSSSTSTSIVVTMVASKILEVPTAIPIVMGANIGTSVTNTLVAMGQIQVRDEFKRAFAGATVHDMFNWLTVIILLPIEVFTGYLQLVSWKMVHLFNVDEETDAEISGLKLLTDPVMKRIVIVDKSVITNVDGKIAALNGTNSSAWDSEQPVLKRWCDTKSHVIGQSVMTSLASNDSSFAENVSVTTNHVVLKQKCDALFNWLGLSDLSSGLILFVASLLLLCLCLVLLVKVLKGVFSGRMSELIKQTVNDDFPGYLSCLTGYVAILVGVIMTILVQSSSVFTSTLTPLVGLDVIKVERVFPLTLGSNIGTTVTGLLAAMAADASTRDVALQIAFCHLLFNVSGILIWYPLPFMRKIPIKLAQLLGETTAKYRWFALFYLVMMFVMSPLFVFLLSLGGSTLTVSVLATLLTCLIFVLAINALQTSQRLYWILPGCLRSWEWLPKALHSLEPWDRFFRAVWRLVRKLICRFDSSSRRRRTNRSTTGTNV